MAERDWNASYANGETPWDTGAPDPHLVKALEAGVISPGRALEIGCGTGTNAVWLGEHGFRVTGIDLSQTAIEKARSKAMHLPEGSCRFEVHDFLADDLRGEPFDFVFDRGCFHVFDTAEERTEFAARVARVLAPGRVWLSLIGSTNGGPRDFGPPQRSAADVISCVEPALELIELRATHFHLGPSSSPTAWYCLSRRR